MSDRLSELAIVSAVAEGAAQRNTRKVIAALQSMTTRCPATISNLKTTWDEDLRSSSG